MTRRVPLPEHADFGIVGGGIIGLSIAYELACRGRRVIVFDDETRAGRATHAAAGMIAPAAESEMEHGGFVELRRWSHSLYPEFVSRLQADSGIDCAFRAEGTLLVALDRDQSVELARLNEIVTSQGFETRTLSAREVRACEPNLSERLLEGLRLPQDFHVDQRRLMLALREANERKGTVLATGARVEAVDAQGRVHGKRLSHGARDVEDAAPSEPVEVQCDRVVVAAGSWTPVDLELPAPPLPVRPVRGQVLRLQAADILHHVVRTPDVYLVPHAGGELVVGASVEEQGFDDRPTAGAVFDLLRHAWRTLPALYDVPLTEIAVGFRPTARDHVPIMGHLSTRVAVATGHYRNGILLAPATARILVALLCDEVEHELLHWFEPQRFSSAPRSKGESCVESA